MEGVPKIYSPEEKKELGKVLARMAKNECYRIRQEQTSFTAKPGTEFSDGTVQTQEAYENAISISSRRADERISKIQEALKAFGIEE